MAKRVKGQITKDHDHSSSDDDVSDEGSGPKLASNEVLKTRKILKPKSLANRGAGSATPSNPFASLGQPAAPASFSFTPKRPSPLTTNSPMNSGNGTANGSGKASKQKALNNNVVQAILAAQKKDELADFTPIFQKYFEYLKDIDSKPAIAQTASVVSAPVNPPKKEDTPVSDMKVDSESESEKEEEKKEIKVQGPTFSIKAPVNLKFGNQDDDDIVFSDDSEDDVKVEGPKFTFSAAPTNNFNGPFKLGEKKEEPKPAFSFGKSEEKKVEPKPAFTFGKPADEKRDESKPAFSFTAEKTDEPAFTFGKSSEEKREKPAFTFGKPAEKNTEESTPAFSFGKPAEEPKPAFSFGNLEAKKDEKTKPAFTFAKPAEESKPATTFDNTEEKKDSPAPLFSFGKPAETPDENKPVPFKFSAPESTKPSVDFTWKPSNGVNIEDGKKDDAKPLFSFSSSNNDSKPLFSFGSTSTIPAPSAASSFNFSFKAPAASNATTTGNDDDNNDDDKPAENEVKGDFSVVKLSEKVEVKNGEEEEDLKMSKRAKLMLFVSTDKENPYQTKGLGEIKLLVNKDTKKARLLMRSEGNGNVLLNTAVSTDLKYEVFPGKGMVKCPALTADGLQMYILKVKTVADAQEIVKSIDDAKANL